MCGIVAAISQRNIVPILVRGLKKLEYRGYDSAGLAVLDTQQSICRTRVQGKVNTLEHALETKPLSGMMGIAHTRWATHGKPIEHNAHPHMSGNEVAVVHNGIIDNYHELRDELIKINYAFNSETDTEILAHLIHYYYHKTNDLFTASQRVVEKVKGTFSFVAMTRYEPESIVLVCHGCPLVIGLGVGENLVASDLHSLLPLAQKVIYLETGDKAKVTIDEVFIVDMTDTKVERVIQTVNANIEFVEKGNYRHFMQKEIFEQPDVIAKTIQGCIQGNTVSDAIFGKQAAKVFGQVEVVQIVACGTSYHAGLVAKYWIEEYANFPCFVEVASEFRYRKTAIQKNTLFIVISQSGETADTIAALRQAKELNYFSTLAICNVMESSLVRESDLVFVTRAGLEIGVASTKAFTTQLTALLMLAIALGQHNGINTDLRQSIIEQIAQLPGVMKQVLTYDSQIKQLARLFVDKQHVLFLGRGVQYPIALEGALKLKEISYIHAEAYPAGELKHGPLALVDKNMPVVTVAPNDQLIEKLKSNLQEVHARGGQLFIFADPAVNVEEEAGITLIKLPSTSPAIAPIVYALPLQALAYHTAVLKGTDVDQPRNLAKSVTVE